MLELPKNQTEQVKVLELKFKEKIVARSLKEDRDIIRNIKEQDRKKQAEEIARKYEFIQTQKRNIMDLVESKKKKNQDRYNEAKTEQNREFGE